MPRNATPITSLRIPEDVLARIDQNAERQGMSRTDCRTDYILSWLPDYYPPAGTDAQARAVVRGT